MRMDVLETVLEGNGFGGWCWPMVTPLVAGSRRWWDECPPSRASFPVQGALTRRAWGERRLFPQILQSNNKKDKPMANQSSSYHRLWVKTFRGHPTVLLCFVYSKIVLQLECSLGSRAPGFWPTAFMACRGLCAGHAAGGLPASPHGDSCYTAHRTDSLRG